MALHPPHAAQSMDEAMTATTAGRAETPERAVGVRARVSWPVWEDPRYEHPPHPFPAELECPMELGGGLFPERLTDVDVLACQSFYDGTEAAPDATIYEIWTFRATYETFTALGCVRRDRCTVAEYEGWEAS